MITTLLPAIAAMSFSQAEIGDDFAKRLSGRDDGIGGALVEVFINPEGEIERCTVTYTQFEETANDRLCRLLEGRDAAQPARGPDGETMHGRVLLARVGRDLVQLPTAEVNPPPDVEVSLAALPDDDEKRATVSVALVVDAQGAVRTCEPVEEEEPLSAIACERAKGLDHPIRRDRRGSPVAYVTPLTVDFVATGG